MEEDNYCCEHRRLGIKQAITAWAIVVAFVLLFGAAELIWPKQAASRSVVTGDFGPAVTISRAVHVNDAYTGQAGDGGQTNEGAVASN
jgi:hypothetical protein